ncbi:MAG: PQQ-binding-like beta-propeller repeat protein, partial [Planctomycetota bacterium]|nr:PQQ-binding-like beta-propeller repeat protein [Planctomycetota bacterium]
MNWQNMQLDQKMQINSENRKTPSPCAAENRSHPSWGKRLIPAAWGILAFSTSMVFCCAAASGEDWLQFRGKGGSSSDGSQSTPLPNSFTETSKVRWKASLPAKGVSSPIVVSDRVFVTASSGSIQDRIYVLCFDGKTGKRIWKREYWATGRGYCHPTSANAAPTPASDGKNIYAFFSSNDLVCLDLDGNLQWFRGLTFDYPKAANDVGMSSSPIVAEGVVICQVENQGDSFVTGIDTETGKSLWRVDRKKSSNWASPAVVAGEGDRPSQVILTDRTGAIGVDLQSGKRLWEISGRTPSVPSTTVVGDHAYLSVSGTTALRFTSDSAKPTELWNKKQMLAGNASPVVHNGEIFVMNGSGAITCCDSKTGIEKWKARTGRASHWA